MKNRHKRKKKQPRKNPGFGGNISSEVLLRTVQLCSFGTVGTALMDSLGIKMIDVIKAVPAHDGEEKHDHETNAH